MSRRKKVVLGDVFTVPVDAERYCIGQVVADYEKSALYLAIYESVCTLGEEPDVSSVLRGTVSLLALSLDAKIYAGHWVVIGNWPVPSDLPLPAYKESAGDSSTVVVVDYSGRRRRPARGQEADWLPFREVVAPVRIEKALRARQGLEEWNESFATLEPTVATSARLFDSV